MLKKILRNVFHQFMAWREHAIFLNFFDYNPIFLLQYVINCIYTNLGASLEAWVQQQVEERNEKVTQEKVIEMDPEMA